MKRISFFFFTVVCSCLILTSLPLLAQFGSGKSILTKMFKKPSMSSKKIAQRRTDEKTPEEEQIILQKIVRQSISLRRLIRQNASQDEINSQLAKKQVNQGNGVISGFVFEQDGTTAIKHVVAIEVFDDVGTYAGIGFVYDFDNYYEVTNLQTGDYYVLATSDFYVDEFYDNATNFSDASLVHVQSGQVTANINFSLQPSTSGTGAISGNVSDPNGLPVYECVIVVYDENYNYIGDGVPDPSGNYSVSDIPAGNYKLFLDYYGSQDWADEWYQNASSFADANIVSVTEGETTGNIDFELDWAGVISGKVVLPDGSPIGEFDYVAVNGFDLDNRYVNTTMSDQNGNFNISGFMTGYYKLSFEYNGINNYIGGWYENANSFDSATPIEVIAGDTTKNIILTLRNAGAISGRVTGPTGAPIEWEVEIIIYNESDQDVRWVQSEENGYYTATGLPEGKYKLFANYTSMYNATSVIQTPASEWYDGVYDEISATWVDVLPGDTTKDINFTLEAGGAIKGNVYSPENSLLDYSGIVAAVNLNGDIVRQGMNANLGQYIVAGLPTGSYKLYFSYEGDQNYMDEWFDGKSNFGTADVINVVAGHWSSGYDFILDYVSGFKGMVKDVSGNPVMGDAHYLFVYFIDAQTEEFVIGDIGSKLGGYSFQLHSGSYKIAACTGFGNWLTKHDSLSLSFYDQGNSLNDPNTKAVTIVPDSIIKLDDIVMQKATGSISGKIYAPITDELVTQGGYFVWAVDEDGCLAKFSTYLDNFGAIDGSYSLRGLKPGIYYLLVNALGGDPDVPVWQTMQWYGGILWNEDIENLTPKLAIPQGAVPVTVGTGDTPDIDFHLLLPSDVSPDLQDKLPEKYNLYQNYPNPFNPKTVIRYEIPRETFVKLAIYNLLGQKVETLVNKKQAAGSYKISWDAGNLPAGIYFYQLKTREFVQTKKCLFLK